MPVRAPAPDHRTDEETLRAEESPPTTEAKIHVPGGMNSDSPEGDTPEQAPDALSADDQSNANPTRRGGSRPEARRGFWDRVEAYLSRLSTRNNFWHRIFSLIWLPYAFRSGIRMKRIDASTFAAVLPFRRFNRNWYNAMAGAALLGNSEIAGGMYVFGICGGDYTVVCKHLEYRFLRPCFGPAMYRIIPREPMEPLIAARGEFNITLDLDVMQQIKKPGEREKRVGKCTATFHVTPKSQHKARKRRAGRTD